MPEKQRVEMDFDTFDNVVEALKSLSEKLKKAQICQGPHSSEGRLAEMNKEVFGEGHQTVAGHIGPTGMDYIPQAPGHESVLKSEPCEQCGDKVEKGCVEKGGDKKEKEKAEGKKKKEEDDKNEEPGGRFDIQKTNKSIPEEGENMENQENVEEVYLVDDVISELTKSVEAAVGGLSARVAFFLKALGDYHLQQANELTERLSLASEAVVKSFGVLEGEEHVPEGAPKSITTADEIGKSEQNQLGKEQVLELMTKSLNEGSNIIRPEDITNFEMHGTYRPEVFESLGITAE